MNYHGCVRSDVFNGLGTTVEFPFAALVEFFVGVLLPIKIPLVVIGWDAFCWHGLPTVMMVQPVSQAIQFPARHSRQRLSA